MMLRQLKSAALALVTLALAPAVIAQATCPAIVETAITLADELCRDVQRNQACYGHSALEATQQEQIMVFDFQEEGDIENVNRIQSIRLQALNIDNETWGIALMRLQANLPATLPGQNVTFLLFGDVEINNAVAAQGTGDYGPMQAFSLQSGLGSPQCDEVPENGLLVQTPEGSGEVTFSVNGVEVAMGSTVIFEAQPEGEMTVTAIEGMAVLHLEDEVQTIIAGTRLRVPVDGDLHPTARLASLRLESYNLRRLIGLPLRLLDRQIEARLPLSQEELSQAIEEVAKGDPICDKVLFPDCSHVPDHLRVRAAIAQREQLETEFQCQFRRFPREPLNEAGASLPFCDELSDENLTCVFLPGFTEPPLPPDETRPFCPQLPIEPEPPANDPVPPPPPIQNDTPRVVTETPSPRQPNDNNKPPTSEPTRVPGGRGLGNLGNIDLDLKQRDPTSVPIIR